MDEKPLEEAEQPMSLEEAIAAAGAPMRGRQAICWYSNFVKERPNDVPRLNELLGEIVGGKRSGASVSRILAKIGTKANASTINRHIRNECQCRDGE